ncbi:MAG TPA: glutaredoxin family protein [Planctomycetaceae bacterium]|nr:glutaredoxin family protein [Planctomycetaceae bacterium]
MTRSLSDRADSQSHHAREFVGRFLVLFGVAMVMLYFFANRPGVRLPLPGFWYRGGELWPFLGTILGIAGFLMQRVPQTISRKWKPSLPGQRFQRVVVYSREECHLCDVAKDSLHKFAEWLPEIEEIDIDDSPELIERYGTEIPVVLFDGVERFRGILNENLLKRLIEGTAPRPVSSKQTAE